MIIIKFACHTLNVQKYSTLLSRACFNPPRAPLLHKFPRDITIILIVVRLLSTIFLLSNEDVSPAIWYSITHTSRYRYAFCNCCLVDCSWTLPILYFWKRCHRLQVGILIYYFIIGTKSIVRCDIETHNRHRSASGQQRRRNGRYTRTRCHIEIKAFFPLLSGSSHWMTIYKWK